jgi:hypothetical protein
VILSKKSHDGEVFIDHRASPGIPAAHAERLGYHPSFVKEGAAISLPSYGCIHCGGSVIVNHGRTRERAWCSDCDVYICDGCDFLRKQPGYVHQTIVEVKDKLNSGKYQIAGGYPGQYILTKTGE